MVFLPATDFCRGCAAVLMLLLASCAGVRVTEPVRLIPGEANYVIQARVGALSDVLRATPDAVLSRLARRGGLPPGLTRLERCGVSAEDLTLLVAGHTELDAGEHGPSLVVFKGLGVGEPVAASCLLADASSQQQPRDGSDSESEPLVFGETDGWASAAVGERGAVALLADGNTLVVVRRPDWLKEVKALASAPGHAAGESHLLAELLPRVDQGAELWFVGRPAPSDRVWPVGGEGLRGFSGTLRLTGGLTFAATASYEDTGLAERAAAQLLDKSRAVLLLSNMLLGPGALAVSARPSGDDVAIDCALKAGALRTLLARLTDLQ